MSMQGLSDNALFIRNWKERMRPHMVGSAACVILLIIMLILIGNFLNQDSITHYNYIQKKSLPVPWLNNALFQLTVLQGIIIFLFGMYSAGKMAGLEKTSGTLDFHRSTPVARANQVIGLVFGGASLEWCLFLGAMVVTVPLIFAARVDSLRFFLFYISLIICAVFLHSLAVLCALYANPKRYRAGSMLVAIYMFSYVAFMLSFIYHLTPCPAYGDLFNMLIEGSAVSNEAWRFSHTNILHSFFGYNVPYLLLQMIVQVPLIALVWAAIKRRFEYGERPVWSKIQSAVFVAMVLFYFTGSLFGYHNNPFYFDLQAQSMAFWFGAFILMLVTAPGATPTQLAFLKGLFRARKMGLARLSANDDRGSNWLWLAAFCLTVTAMFFIVAKFHPRVAPYKLGVLLATGLCYIIFFCAIYEYFNLSKYHQKKSVLITGILIFWFLVPAFGFITKTVVASPGYLQYFLAPSPFFGMAYLSSILRDYQSTDIIIQPNVFIAITAVMALCSLLLARRARSNLIKTIL